MAHGDYDCCAICDCKIKYNGFDSLTKEKICESCLIGLRINDVHVITFEELIKWVNETDKEFVGKVLKEMGYQRCFYPNRFDTLIDGLGLFKN